MYNIPRGDLPRNLDPKVESKAVQSRCVTIYLTLCKKLKTKHNIYMRVLSHYNIDIYITFI